MSATIKLGATGGKILFSTSGTAGNGTPGTGFGGLYYGSDGLLRLITDTGTITEYTPDVLHPPSGSSGTSGNSRSSGTSGDSGSSGSSGTSGIGSAGTNGISGNSPVGPTGPGFSFGANSVTSNLAGSLNNSALATNGTGFGNLALGGQSLQSNTVGFRNISCGYNAMAANISGDDNVQIANTNLNFLTTGNRNVQLGVLNFIHDSGSDNVCLSTEGGAGSVGNPKNLNTCIGWRNSSLGNNNTQIGNVIVGATGNNRTQIGQNFTNTGLDDAIVLGYPHDCIIHSSYIQSGTYSADRRIPITIEGVTYYLLLDI
jgi:hypothetical protein